MASCDSLSPTAVIGGAWSQSEWGEDTERSLAVSSSLTALIITIIIIIIIINLGHSSVITDCVTIMQQRAHSFSSHYTLTRTAMSVQLLIPPFLSYRY